MKFLVDLLWGPHILAFILCTGLRFSGGSLFFQLRKFRYWLGTALTREKPVPGEVSGFQALTTALAGSIGTGNLVGVGLAISVGGAGALFWMWVSALLGMMTVFAEAALATVYRKEGLAKGALCYIEKLGKFLPMVYALGCVLSSLAMGNMAQSSSVAAAGATIGLPPWVTGVALAFLLFAIMGKGLTGVTRVTEKLVPCMTALFFVVSLVALFRFRGRIPAALEEVFAGAFTLRGGLGGGMFLAIKTGISRGVFTNEAGLGSSSMAFGAVRGKSPREMGCLGIFQVFLDTIVMCSVTGLCILVCTADRSGDFLVRLAFENALGPWGKWGINLCMALFAFATMTATCYYGQVGMDYLTHKRLGFLFPYLFSCAAFLGAVLPLGQVFDLCDAFNGLMAIPNLIALAYFGREAMVHARKS